MGRQWGPVHMLLRAGFGAATFFTTWLSDRLHNMDLQGCTKQHVGIKLEFDYWRLDLFSISLILFAQCILWSFNLAWALPWNGIPTAVCGLLGTFAVGSIIGLRMTHKYASQCMYGSPFIRTSVRQCSALMGMQFLCTGYVGLVCHLKTECGFF